MNKDYKTITEKGKRLEYLDHEIILMKTEKKTKINEVYENIKNCTHMTVEGKYLSSTSHTIELIRTWENDSMTINYKDGNPLLGVSFNYDDILGIGEEKNMYTHIFIKLNGDVKLVLS